MKTQKVTALGINCLDCHNGVISVPHGPFLPGTTSGPHWCPHCGIGHRFDISKEGEVVISVTNKRIVRHMLSLLRLKQDIEGEPVYLVVKDQDYYIAGERLSIEEINHNRKRHFEVMCPGKLLLTTILHGYNDDPHGLFVHVQTIDWPDPEEWQRMGMQPCPTTQDERFDHILNFERLQLLFSEVK
jgi:hypothetical protein